MSSGAPRPAKPVNPQKEAQAQIQVMNEQQRIDQAAEERRRAYEEQQRQQELQRWQSSVGSAYQAANDYGTQRYGELGLTGDDPYGIMSTYKNELDMRKATIPELGTVGAYFNNTAFDDVLNRIRTTQRNSLTNQLNQYAGTDFSKSQFADTADDDILNSILGTQYTDARNNLDRQKARGQIDMNTFERALMDLDNQKGSAFSKLQDLGGGVLGNYRKQLDDSLGSLKNKIGSWDFNSPVDLGSERGNLDSLINGFKGRLEGDVRNAVGSTSLFDIPTLIAKSRATIGSTNTARPANGGTDPLTEELRRTNASQGAF